MGAHVAIRTHTTTSSPRPHILYVVQVTVDGVDTIIHKRYSEFVTLHETLKDPYALPPKRILSTSFFPSAWIDDALIAERKTGLSRYLNDLLTSSEYVKNPLLIAFLSNSSFSDVTKFNFEDIVPSTLTKKDRSIQVLSDSSAASATLIAASYYVDWESDSFPPESLDYSRWDILNFAFATPSSSFGLTFDSGSEAVLKRLATAAHNSGWGGCEYYSAAVSTATNRSKFISAIQSAISTNGLDGVDLDWEYPNSPGAGQPYSSADSANFLTFLTSLRSALGSSKIISAAVPDLPWLGSNGQPLTNVAAYAAQLTYLNIMYENPVIRVAFTDLWSRAKPQASAEAALAQWKAAGFPASKLLLGLPLYGYVSESSKTTLTGSLMPSSNMLLLYKDDRILNGQKANNMPHFLNAAHPRLRKLAGTAAADANLTAYWGQQIAFNTLVQSGALVKNSSGNYGQGGGFTMAWDNCSDTPFLYNTSQTTVVTYDGGLLVLLFC
ncbi:hypothetical protein H0H92_013999 [Tricholoma furcatifolium]|nr:hypothetical protein H0H92_013999 [Tricholoma furcatifolium]